MTELPSLAPGAPTAHSSRGVYCNRTLNFRNVKAIGYDMDYTLVHYQVEEWERRAYEYARTSLEALGWPVAQLQFDTSLVIRGLILDLELGNVVKANRFGFVKKATHGTRPLDFNEMRDAYTRTLIDLREPRWVFLNTLFSLSEGSLYAQLVDLLDAKKLPEPMGYWDLYEAVRVALDKTHVEGALKREVITSPDRFVQRDPETPLTLLDQKHAGKKLLLITNSEWEYTNAMMSYAFNPFLPTGNWRDLFDIVVVSARKPDFFTGKFPFFEVVNEEGLLRPTIGALKTGSAYLGGSAVELERRLGISGDEILYVGDHMFGDVHFTKSVLRWRTALILRELEEEIDALSAFTSSEGELAVLMAEKEAIELEQAQHRVDLQRARAGYGPRFGKEEVAPTKANELDAEVVRMRAQIEALDVKLAPLAKKSSELSNPTWGLLTRAGNDKSHLARQIERYADIYTSRVSNFLHITPFAYLRSPRGSLPHDPGAPPAAPIVPAPP